MDKLLMLCSLLFVVFVKGFPSTETEDTGDICNKGNFIKNFADKELNIEQTKIDSITKNCQSANPRCVGTDSFELIYAQSLSDQYFFIITLTDLLKNDTAKNCWGFALEILRDDEKSTKYFNFIEKNDTLVHYEPAVAGQTYTFTLVSLPSGVKESISMKAPDACGNEIQRFIYEKERKLNWFGECPEPGIQAKLDFSEKVCKEKKNIGEIKKSIQFNGATCQFEISTETTDGRTDEGICSKEDFIRKYVDNEMYIQPSAINFITKNCQPTNLQCIGTNNLEVMYAKENATGKYMFLVKSQHLLSKEAKDCWGFALEVYNDEKQSTKYFNFKEKKEEFNYVQPVVAGNTYIFTLISVPSGLQEIISLKAPGDCGNNLLGFLYTKSQNDGWEKGCNSPDFREKLNFVDKFCKGVNNQEEYDEYKVQVSLNSTTCQLVLPAQVSANYKKSLSSLSSKDNFKSSGMGRLFRTSNSIINVVSLVTFSYITTMIYQ